MFEWDDKYSVKIDYIDEEHKQLLAIGKKVEDLLKDQIEDKYEQIVMLIEKLMDYTQYHFSSEEWLMDKYQYPDLANHKQEHNKFVDYLLSVDIKTINEVQEETIKALLSFIAKWISEHLIYTDGNYSEYIVHAMNT